ncbi:hypothetical protein BVY01_04865, partial [bacterium I07]
YMVPEKRQLQYMMFTFKPSHEDTLETKQDIRNILESIQNGADFSELAKDYSEDTGSAEKGGDLGFFGKGVMVKAFEEAAFEAAIGEVIGPVETEHGLHLIKVLAKKTGKRRNAGPGKTYSAEIQYITRNHQ